MFALRTLKMIVDTLIEDSSPQKLAWAVAWGMLIGLVPKDNLIAAMLMVIVCSLRVNLTTAFTSAFLFSWLGTFTDPVSDWLGTALLTNASLEPYWTQLYNLPVMPWTSFNNTVVLGSLLIGIAFMYPVRCAAEPVAIRCLPHIQARLNKWRVGQWLARTETVVNVGRG